MNSSFCQYDNEPDTTGYFPHKNSVKGCARLQRKKLQKLGAQTKFPQIIVQNVDGGRFHTPYQVRSF